MEKKREHIGRIDLGYYDLLKRIQNGFEYVDPNRGIKRIQIPSYTLEYVTSGINGIPNDFPILLGKAINWNSVVTELLWFLSGEMDITYLHEHGVHIWDLDAESYFKRESNNTKTTHNGKETYIGRGYGYQWRSFNGYSDQIAELILDMRANTFNTRRIVTAWNPTDINETALPPCHWSFEIISVSNMAFYIKWHQRSVDTFLGLPFNISSYALLGSILARATGKVCTGIIGDLSNVHLYENHVAPANVYKRRVKRFKDNVAQPVQLAMNGKGMELLDNWKQTDNVISISDAIKYLKPEDFELKNYKPMDAIKAKMTASKK